MFCVIEQVLFGKLGAMAVQSKKTALNRPAVRLPRKTDKLCR